MNITILGEDGALLEEKVISAIYDKGSESEVYKAAKEGRLLLITSKFYDEFNAMKKESDRIIHLEKLSNSISKASLIITKTTNCYQSGFDLSYALRLKVGVNKIHTVDDLFIVDYSYISKYLKTDHVKMTLNNTFRFNPEEITSKTNIEKPVEVLSLLTQYKRNKSIIITSSEINENTNIYPLLF